jgi:hypothetical protein
MTRAPLLPVLLTAIFGVVSSPHSALAEQAQSGTTSPSQSGITIKTTVIFREKESDCPSGYTMFLGGSGGKFPTDPKICYVRTSHPAGK